MNMIILGVLVVYFIIVDLLVFYLIRDISVNILKQLILVFFSFGSFFLAALFSKKIQDISFFWMLLEGLAILPLCVMSLTLFIRKNLKTWNIKTIKNYLIQNKYVVLLIAIIFITRFWMLDTVQKWDSDDYYFSIINACSEFDFTPMTFFKEFKLINHPSYGYAFWAGIGEFIMPGNPSGVIFINLLLTILACVKLYKLLLICQPRLNHKNAFMGTLIISCIPLFWGSCSYIMPDYLLSVFLILMIYSDANQEWILLFFWGLMACFSKEIGIVLVAAYYMTKAIILFLGTDNSKNLLKKAKYIIKHPAIRTGCLNGIFVIVYLFWNQGVSSWRHSVYYSNPIHWSGDGSLLYNTFGIQKDNICTRLKEYFFVNFSWIFTLLLICTLFLFIKKKLWKKIQFQMEYVAGIAGILITYAIFMCLYITSGAIRYNVVFTLLFIVFVYILFVEVASKKVFWGISVVSICLMFVQNFYSIDVITNTMFTTVNVGNTKLLCIGQKSNLNPGGDYYVTNLQYRTISKNFEKMFQNIQLAENDVVLIAGENYVECTKNASLSELNGRHNSLKWKSETNSYENVRSEIGGNINTLTTNRLWGLNGIPIKDTQNVSEHVLNILNGIKGKIYVYFSPLFQSENKDILLEQLGTVFDIGKIESVETGGNVLEFCELYKKDNNDIKKNIKKSIIESQETEITEDVIFNREQQKFAIEFEGDRDVTQIGDTLAISIACYEDGKFLNLGYSPKGLALMQITLGIGNVFPEVEDTLLGAKVGDTVETVCRFPENYRNNSELAGKIITMEICINSIVREVPK